MKIQTNRTEQINAEIEAVNSFLEKWWGESINDNTREEMIRDMYHNNYERLRFILENVDSDFNDELLDALNMAMCAEDRELEALKWAARFHFYPNSYVLEGLATITPKGVRIFDYNPLRGLVTALTDCADYLAEFLEEGREHRVVKAADAALAKATQNQFPNQFPNQ